MKKIATDLCFRHALQHRTHKSGLVDVAPHPAALQLRCQLPIPMVLIIPLVLIIIMILLRCLIILLLILFDVLLLFLLLPLLLIPVPII